MNALAGESSRVKLGELVDAGVILPGDVWRFNYVFGKGEGRIAIDKEAWVRSPVDLTISHIHLLIIAGSRYP